jgi:uncharacterized protein (DUF302 family)
MSYHFSKILNCDYSTAIAKVTDELKKQSFGIVTEIDMSETLKNKLNVDFRKYKILGACNPNFAYRALQIENKIGTMLPCNIVVQEIEKDKIEVSAVDPVASMMAIKNDELAQMAIEVRSALKTVIENL